MPDKNQILQAKTAGLNAGKKNQNRTGSNRWAGKSGKGNAKLAEIFDGHWVLGAEEAGHR